jgi:hypothetical protein
MAMIPQTLQAGAHKSELKGDISFQCTSTTLSGDKEIARSDHDTCSQRGHGVCAKTLLFVSLLVGHHIAPLVSVVKIDIHIIVAL